MNGWRSATSAAVLVGIAALLCSTVRPAVGSPLDPVYLVKDIAPGLDYPDAQSSISQMGEAGGVTYFVYAGGLWKTDGTSEGTVFLRGERYRITFVGSFGNELYYSAGFDRANELWRSDGTVEGTRPVRWIEAAGTQGWAIGEGTEFAGTFVFAAYMSQTEMRLWRTDGTEATTAPLRDLGLSGDPMDPRKLYVVGDQLLFAARFTGTGEELWRLDSTLQNATLVKDIYPGSQNSMDQPGPCVVLGGKLYFLADDGVNGPRIWVSDGSEAGTQMLLDPNLPATPSSQDKLCQVGSLIFFEAYHVDTGYELWVTDGTAGGTHLVKDLTPGPANMPRRDLTSSGDLLYFGGFERPESPTNAGNYTLWSSDGTAAGTHIVRTPTTAEGPYGALSIIGGGGRVFFEAQSQLYGEELWVSDGTSAGTHMVKDINPSASGSPRLDVVEVHDGLGYFRADDTVHGREFWVSDGTEPGTFMLRDFGQAILNSNPRDFCALGDKIVFSAFTKTEGREPWVSDGTESGTVMLKDIGAGVYDSIPGDFVCLGDEVLFTAQTEMEQSSNLWSTDGTPGGTQVAADLPDIHGLQLLEYATKGPEKN